MKTIDPPIIVKATYNCSATELWKAISDITEMKQWYFDNIPEFDSKVGFETVFEVKSDIRTFTHQWEVTHVQIEKLLQYNWTFSEYEGESFTRFEIDEMDDHCVLQLTCITTKDFPDDIAEFERESCIGGWNFFLNERLKNYLENKS